MGQERLEARIEALEWVIQTAISAALGPTDRQAQRRHELVEAIVSSHGQSAPRTQTDAAVPNEPAHLLSVTEVAQVLGIGRGTAYELVRTNELPAVRIGRRLLVPRHLMLDWIKQRAHL